MKWFIKYSGYYVLQDNGVTIAQLGYNNKTSWTLVIVPWKEGIEVKAKTDEEAMNQAATFIRYYYVQKSQEVPNV